MVGLVGLEQGVGLDVVPSLAVRRRRPFDGTAATSDTDPSLDVFYKLSPSLTGALTINTDFSATEVDDRQVNLTRFGLFFPEKRDFFLREADIFEFGRIGASDGTGALSNAERQNARPFFSRRIGLGEFGEPVDLNYGGKISGRAGRFEVGALSIRQDENPLAGVDDTTLSVIRAKAGIGRESTIGAVFTDGDPLNPRDNSLAGFDASTITEHRDLTEKIIRKLRAGMMPPAGARRPAGDTLLNMAVSFETAIDTAAAGAVTSR